MIVRIGLAILALNELIVGAWNQFAPRSFYDNFPTVDLTPPFSEHYARDFGGATLGIAVLLVVALIRPNSTTVGMAALAYTVFSAPHFAFHLEHLEGSTAAQAAFLIAGTGVVAVIGVLLCAWSVVRMRRERRAIHHPPLG